MEPISDASETYYLITAINMLKKKGYSKCDVINKLKNLTIVDHKKIDHYVELLYRTN